MENSLDWLADKACNILEKNCGKVYADIKRERLDGVDRFDVLIWLNNLDKRNLEDLADTLNISFVELDVTRKTVRSL